MTFFADDPVDAQHDSSDSLGRRAFAIRLAALIQRVGAESESSVLGLVGPWGGGKSSVLNLSTASLSAADGTWAISEFNPWAYQDLDLMLLGFFSELAVSLPDEARPSQVRQKMGGVIRRLSPIGKVAGLLGLDAEQLIDSAGQLLSGDTSPSAERKKLADALREANTRVLVVVDDMDRLGPQELLLVLKLVRFVGRLPNVYYLLAYDERTLIDVLAQTELCGSTDVSKAEARSRELLEKIVQVRIDLPPLSSEAALQIIREGLSRISATRRSPADGQRLEELLRVYRRYMRSRLGTPRSLNRYLAQLDSALVLLGEEVDLFDFAILTYVRTVEPVLYRNLYALRDDVALSRPRMPPATDKNETRRRWTDWALSSKVLPEDVDDILGLLGELFLAVGPAAFGASGVTAEDIAAMADRRAIGHWDYFDRYFEFRE